MDKVKQLLLRLISPNGLHPLVELVITGDTGVGFVKGREPGVVDPPAEPTSQQLDSHEAIARENTVITAMRLFFAVNEIGLENE